MSTLRRPALAVFAGALILCSCGDRRLPAPYRVGLVVKATQDQVVRSTSYRSTRNGGPVESKGVFGSGPSCTVAAQSTGVRRTEVTLSRDISWEVVGQTPWDHPLLPGKDFSRTWLSIVEDETVTQGTSSTHETFRDGDPTTPDWFEDAAADLPRTTDARFYGVAADAYLIKVTSLDLWNGLEDTALNQVPLELETSEDWVGRNSHPLPTVQLLTKHRPRNGDLWSSTNGNFLFFYTGRDAVKIGGEDDKGDRVLIKTTGPVDPTAGSVLEDCLVEGQVTFTTDNPDTGIVSQTVDAVTLDAQCTTAFRFQVVGHEWWVDDVLARAETTTWEVQVTDFGYEWYDLDPTETSCARVTSTERTDPRGVIYVDYTVSAVETLYQARSIDRKKRSEAGPEPRGRAVDGA